MKKITFLFLLLTVSFSYAQENLEDFEGSPVFEGANGLGQANVVADPLDAGNTVGEIISSAAGEAWQNANLIMQDNLMDLSTDITVQVDVYSTSSFTMLARLDDTEQNVPSTPATADEIYTAGSGWQTLTFTFNEELDGQATADGQYSQIGFFPNWVGSNAGNNPVNNNWNNPTDFTVYVDNITAVRGLSLPIENCMDGILNNEEEQVDCGGPNCAPCPSAPTEAAPTQPFRAGENVRSIFCSDYTNIAIDTYDTPWCGATTTTVDIAGRPTQRVTGLGCEGIEFVSGRFDATEFPFFHMDIWTDSDTMDKSFNFKFSDWQGGTMEVGALEYSMTNASSPVVLPNPNPGTWISIDLQLSDFTVINGVDGSDFVQFIITSNLVNVYYDNLYVHNNNLSVDEFSLDNISVYPNPTLNVWNVKTSAQTINSIQVFDILGKQVLTLNPNTQDAVIDASTLNSGLYFAKVNSDAGTQTLKLVRE
ncbi:T9SS type A sorting domain-containing protein [Oceanihabitans sp.]|nr:T9SS type A sorting domain-containing protein [Oceanihabitans sp.]